MEPISEYVAPRSGHILVGGTVKAIIGAGRISQSLARPVQTAPMRINRTENAPANAACSVVMPMEIDRRAAVYSKFVTTLSQ
jgi:hypothetical protein